MQGLHLRVGCGIEKTAGEPEIFQKWPKILVLETRL